MPSPTDRNLTPQPTKTAKPTRRRQTRHFTQLDQVTQLVAARDADPELGFMARLLALCSLPRIDPKTGELGWRPSRSRRDLWTLRRLGRKPRRLLRCAPNHGPTRILPDPGVRAAGRNPQSPVGETSVAVPYPGPGVRGKMGRAGAQPP